MSDFKFTTSNKTAHYSLLYAVCLCVSIILSGIGQHKSCQRLPWLVWLWFPFQPYMGERQREEFLEGCCRPSQLCCMTEALRSLMAELWCFITVSVWGREGVRVCKRLTLSKLLLLPVNHCWVRKMHICCASQLSHRLRCLPPSQWPFQLKSLVLNCRRTHYGGGSSGSCQVNFSPFRSYWKHQEQTCVLSLAAALFIQTRGIVVFSSLDFLCECFLRV